MTSSEDHNDLVHEDLYYQTVSDHEQLQERLPKQAVVSLAREVLNRLAQQMKKPADLPDDVPLLASALIGSDAKAAATLVQGHLNDGIPAALLYRPYLARAARVLGEQWETDEVTFAELSVGIGRIYAIMRTLRQHIKPKDVSDRKSAIFASVPGDTHTLGVKMAADLARKDGWDVDLMLDLDHDTLIEAITGSGQLLVGISGAGEHSLPGLARLVLAIRISAPEAVIMVSGNVLDVAAESVKLMHVDAVAREYEEAMSTLDDLWQSLQQTKIA